MTISVEFLESLIEEIEEDSKAKPKHLNKLLKEWELSPDEVHTDVSGSVQPVGMAAMMCSQAKEYEVTRNIEALCENRRVVLYIPNDHQISPDEPEFKNMRSDSMSSALHEINEITDSVINVVLSDSMIGILNYLEMEENIFHLDEITEQDLSTIQHHLDIEKIESNYDAKIANIHPERILSTRRNQATLDGF